MIDRTGAKSISTPRNAPGVECRNRIAENNATRKVMTPHASAIEFEGPGLPSHDESSPIRAKTISDPEVTDREESKRAYFSETKAAEPNA